MNNNDIINSLVEIGHKYKNIDDILGHGLCGMHLFSGENCRIQLGESAFCNLFSDYDSVEEFDSEYDEAVRVIDGVVFSALIEKGAKK